MLSFLIKLYEEEEYDQELVNSIEKHKFSMLSEFLNTKFEISKDTFKLIDTKKRNEEYLKFVVKRGFKYLFKKFKKNLNYFISQDKLEKWRSFYSYYFKEEANTHGVPLYEYYLPYSKIYKEAINGKNSCNIT